MAFSSGTVSRTNFPSASGTSLLLQLRAISSPSPIIPHCNVCAVAELFDNFAVILRHFASASLRPWLMIVAKLLCFNAPAFVRPCSHALQCLSNPDHQRFCASALRCPCCQSPQAVAVCNPAALLCFYTSAETLGSCAHALERLCIPALLHITFTPVFAHLCTAPLKRCVPCFYFSPKIHICVSTLFNPRFSAPLRHCNAADSGKVT